MPIILIVYRAFELASKTSSYFYKLVCVGVVSYIGSQTFVNLGGISGTIPLTGVPLPFISFGGSSMISLSIAMGLLLITAKQIKVDESKRRQQRKHTKNFSVPKIINTCKISKRFNMQMLETFAYFFICTSYF